MNILSKKILSYLFLLVMSLLYSKNLNAHIETRYSLYGTIGDRPVILEMWSVENFWSGRYCYLDEKRDIYMKTECDSFGCVMLSTKWDKESETEKTLETIEIKEDSLYTWHGTWHGPSGETQPILLKSIYPDSIQNKFDNHLFVRELDPYTYMKISDLEFKMIRKEKIAKNLQIIWYKEKYSGIMSFRLGKGFDEKESNRANKILEEIHIRDALSKFGCGSIGYKGEMKQSIEIMYANPHIVSFIKRIEGNCQGVTESLKNYYFNFSVDSGRFLDLDDILWFGEGKIPRKGSQEYFKYRYNTLGNSLMNILLEMYPDKMENENCNYAKPTFWQFPEWYLRPDGICIVTKAYELKKECRETYWSIIPYDSVKTYIKQKYFR